jgi:short-subunit dehydrogenase
VSCLCPGPTASKFRERAGTGKTRLTSLGTPMSSQSVAEEGYRGFQQNERVVITGARNRLVARAVPFVPRRRILDFAYRLMSPV